MKRRTILACTFCSLTLSSWALADRFQTEVTKATTPEQDAKPNDPNIPEGVATTGTFQRIIVFRFKHQTDLLAGIEKLVKTHGIKNGVILSGIGSVMNYHVHAVSNRTFPSKNIYIKDTQSPADLIGMNGYIVDGRVHAHMTLADSEKAFGGHLEPDTHVFTFAIITIGQLSDEADLTRFDDKTFR